MRARLITLICCMGWMSALFAADFVRPQSADFIQGVTALENGKPDSAYTFLTHELAQHPDNGYAHCYMAFVCNYYENPKLALKAIDLALKYLPVADNEYRSLAYYTRGMIFLKHNEWVLAESDFNDAILTNPNDAANYISRAQVYFKTDRWEEGMEDMHHALAIDQKLSVDDILGQIETINQANAR